MRAFWSIELSNLWSLSLHKKKWKRIVHQLNYVERSPEISYFILQKPRHLLIHTESWSLKLICPTYVCSVIFRPPVPFHRRIFHRYHLHVQICITTPPRSKLYGRLRCPQRGLLTVDSTYRGRFLFFASCPWPWPREDFSRKPETDRGATNRFGGSPVIVRHSPETDCCSAHFSTPHGRDKCSAHSLAQNRVRYNV